MTVALERVSLDGHEQHGQTNWWQSYTVTFDLLCKEFGQENLPAGLPPRIFVVDSEAGRRFLTGRHLWGWRKIKLIKEVTRSLVQPLVDIFKESNGEVTQFVPLSGADPMKIGKALHHALIYPFTVAPMATAYIEADRKEQKDGSFKARVRKPLKKFPKHPVAVIVDTCCASGSTLQETVRRIIDWYKTDKKPLRKIIFFTACGSLEALQGIWAYCQRRCIEFIPVFSVGLHRVFDEPGVLGKRFTDLSPISETAIMPASFIPSANVYFQEKPMCAVGDVGDSLSMKFELYLFETLRELAILKMDLNRSPWCEMRSQIPTTVYLKLQSEHIGEFLYYRH
ncbi:MAG: hypothetical protein WC663_01580 [Patescibacteria group bacterium]